MFDFVSFIPRAIVQGIPLLFGSTGETLTEKSGNLNLGIAGIMYVGGISGVIGAFLYEQGAGGAAGMNGFLAVMIRCCRACSARCSWDCCTAFSPSRCAPTRTSPALP